MERSIHNYFKIMFLFTLYTYDVLLKSMVTAGCRINFRTNHYVFRKGKCIALRCLSTLEALLIAQVRVEYQR